MADRRVILSRAALHLIVTLPTGDYSNAEAQAFIDAAEQSMPRVFRELGLPPVDAASWRAEELTELACAVLALDYQRRRLLAELRRWSRRGGCRCDVSRFGGGRCVRQVGHDGPHAFEAERRG